MEGCRITNTDGIKGQKSETKTSRSGEKSEKRKESSKGEEQGSFFPTEPEEQFTMFQTEQLLAVLCGTLTVMLMAH